MRVEPAAGNNRPGRRVSLKAGGQKIIQAEEQTVESLLEAWGGESVILSFDRPTGAWIVIAVHSTRLGSAAGGTRMKAYASLAAAVADALNLAEGMTYKCALAGLPHGGGKAVISVPERGLAADERRGLLLRYGSLIRQYGTVFDTGPDVGTSSADMDVIAETGAPYVFGCTAERGGAGDSGPATALGVFSGIEAACEHLYGSADLTGRSVVVQGAGSVGGALIGLLREAGARLRFSDADPQTVERLRDQEGLDYVQPEEVYDAECDIFSPCALGGVLNAETIPRLRARAVVGAANNQLRAPEDAERLRARGILYAPDFVVNIGGALVLEGIESLGWTLAQVEERIRAVRATLAEIFAAAEREGLTTEAVARRLAEERIASAPPRGAPGPSA